MNIENTDENQSGQQVSIQSHPKKSINPNHLICRGLALLVSLPILFVAAIYYGWINP